MGKYDDFWETKMIGCKSFNKFERTKVIVNYSKTIEQAVKAGKYTYVNYLINSQNFPDAEAKRGVESTQEKDKVTIRVSLVQIPPPLVRFYIADVEDALNNLGYRPANLYELLALGAQHQDLQRAHLIVGMGSSWTLNSDQYCVPYIYGDGSWRGLSLRWNNIGCDGSWRFAAVSKNKI